MAVSPPHPLWAAGGLKPPGEAPLVWQRQGTPAGTVSRLELKFSWGWFAFRVYTLGPGGAANGTARTLVSPLVKELQC